MNPEHIIFHQKQWQWLSSYFNLSGWVQDSNGEWDWQEEDEDDESSAYYQTTTTTTLKPPIDGIEALKQNNAFATPQLPTGKFRPKQSLGQNFLNDGNTVQKIVRAFALDAATAAAAQNNNNDNDDDDAKKLKSIVELGPGAGALTDALVKVLGTSNLHCIEIDSRAISILKEKHPDLHVIHNDVLQVDYHQLCHSLGGEPIAAIGNLPYYITSQILFALADASHVNAVRSATVTMQYEVARRVVSPIRCKDYGILSVVFQLYAECDLHFKIPPSVFYPKPKVDSALVGLQFVGEERLRKRLGGVRPSDLRRVLTCVFQQRRKTVRNGLKKLVKERVGGGDGDLVKDFFDKEPPSSVVEDEDDWFVGQRALPSDWASKRPEELNPAQFVELTRLVFGPERYDEEQREHSLGKKVWRKAKHGSN